MTFHTDYRYTGRETKAEYVWLKYKPILQKSKILDVGADECYLKRHLDEEASYWGIGMSGHPDQQVDLERESIPFPDNSFDCVLCLDVLEHLDNIHEVFDELCRITGMYAIISLPNPWAAFYKMLCFGNSDRPLAWYGLPPERPEDRHKWFFSNQDAEAFVMYRAGKNDMEIVQMDYEGMANEGQGWRALVRAIARWVLLDNRDLNLKSLYASTLWVVLRKSNREDTLSLSAG